MEPKPVVLGAQIAAAYAAERARLDAGASDPSPLQGRAYDVERDHDLMHLSASPLDDEIGGLVESWRASAPGEREAVTCALSLDDNYTLIHFARRMAVRALNQTSEEDCERGMTALAMIDEARIDPRDASWAAGLLNHAAHRWPGRATDLLEQAASLATRAMGELLRQSSGSTLESWGYCEIRTPEGVGLVRAGWERYEPTLNLVDVAVRIGSEVLSDRYICEIEVATDLPSVWFHSSGHAGKTLERALGVVSINGTLRRSVGDSVAQMFVMWIAEMPLADDCEQLVADVGDGVGQSGRFAVGVAAGRVFALIVAGSVQQDVQPYESLATVRELADRARTVLPFVAS